MVLQRVIRQVLLALGEHHAVDLGLGVWPGQRDVLVDLGQPLPRAPIVHCKRRVAADDGLLMGEVPDARAPVLQVHVPQPGAGADEQLDRAAVQVRRPFRRRWPFRPSSVASAPSSRTTSVWPRSTPPSVRPVSMCSGSSIATPCGTYSSVPPDQHAACSAANLSTCGSTAGEQMRANQIAVFDDQLVEAAEQHALPRPFLIQPCATPADCRASPLGRPASRLPSAARAAAVRTSGTARSAERTGRARNRRMSVRIHSSSFCPGIGSSQECLPSARGAARRAKRAPRRAARNASKASCVKPDCVVDSRAFSDRIRLRPPAVPSVANANYPTDPSICNWISRFISTAYSIGSSLTSGSMKPLTIIVLASASDRPRLIR